jgi:hypothetical protein
MTQGEEKMANRRSIADAVTLTPKLDAFVKTGLPDSGDSPRLDLSADTAANPSETPPSGTRRPPGRPRRSLRTPAVLGEPDLETQTNAKLDEMLVPITTKLRRKTIQALRRVHLEQKLRDAKPATQQEIIEEAIHDWLTRNGAQAPS